jgi:hypothetical protein
LHSSRGRIDRIDVEIVSQHGAGTPGGLVAPRGQTG